MRASEVPRAVAAATSIASALGLAVDDAIVVHDSNRLAVRLLPCDVLARVAHAGDRAAQFEVELAQRLAETDSPVAALEPRVEPLVYEMDGFVVTLWPTILRLRKVLSWRLRRALERLHEGMRGSTSRTPHYTDRVAEAQEMVEQPDTVQRSRTPTGSFSAARCDAGRAIGAGPPSSSSCTASRTRATC